MAVLIPSLDELRDEFNDLSPGRDKASDGWIGDTRHQSGASDHNPDESGRPEVRDADTKDEVHAIDVDDDLRKPGVTMAAIVAFIVARCRAGLEKRLRYVIYNRTIWSASNGWKARAYTGSNPHTSHAHFSGSYDSAQESDRRAWGVRTFKPSGGSGGSTPAKSAPLKVDGRLGPLTIRQWQKVMGTPQDGKISERSPLVGAVQRHLNNKIKAGLVVDSDGDSIRQGGPATKTVRALQRYLGTQQDGKISAPVSEVVKALQRRLNTSRF